MCKEKLKEIVLKKIDENADRIIDIGKKIYENPELGYKEKFATDLVIKELESLGLEVDKNLSLTGCRARANKGKEGPKIAVMGELDAVICREHENADLETGAIHACGHNIQVAGMLGVAIGLIESNVLDKLDGKVDFYAVPAEEYVELDYRSKLKEKEKINYFGGKQELVYKGYLDDVDISIMFHSLNTGDKKEKALVGANGNGFVGKKVQFIGKESHAGGAPEKGVNALNAAVLAINNINAQRETFPESERIRVHPIITKGGDLVNIVPADVRMETYVRGKSINGMLEANEKVNNSLVAGALAIGAKVKITEIPGYLPLLNNNDLDKIFESNLSKLIPQDEIVVNGDFTGSTDFGDVSHIMPSLHPFIGGVTGDLHTREFRVDDPYLAYIVPAKSMALTIIDLLYEDAKEAKKVINNFEPKMTKEEYLNFLKKVSKEILK